MGLEGCDGVVLLSEDAAVSNSGCSEEFTGFGCALFSWANFMGSDGFQVLSFGFPTLAYVRFHCHVEAIDTVRGAASTGRVRSARKAPRGSMAGRG